MDVVEPEKTTRDRYGFYATAILLLPFSLICFWIGDFQIHEYDFDSWYEADFLLASAAALLSSVTATAAALLLPPVRNERREGLTTLLPVLFVGGYYSAFLSGAMFEYVDVSPEVAVVIVLGGAIAAPALAACMVRQIRK